jgi:AhpD family alkylhydroperoxidase
LDRFEARFPGAWRQYRALREACDRTGPLDAKTRELIKIGIGVARKRQGGLIAHIDRAKAAGATDQEISHALLLALPLVGLPDVLDAFVVAKKRLG